MTRFVYNIQIDRKAWLVLFEVHTEAVQMCVWVCAVVDRLVGRSSAGVPRAARLFVSGWREFSNQLAARAGPQLARLASLVTQILLQEVELLLLGESKAELLAYVGRDCIPAFTEAEYSLTLEAGEEGGTAGEHSPAPALPCYMWHHPPHQGCTAISMRDT